MDAFLASDFDAAAWLDAAVPPEACTSPEAAEAAVQAAVSRLQLMWAEAAETAGSGMAHVSAALPRARRDVGVCRGGGWGRVLSVLPALTPALIAHTHACRRVRVTVHAERELLVRLQL